MLKNVRRFLLMGIVLAFVLSMSSICFAAETSFSKKSVDSNTWTFICSAKKDGSTTYGELKLTNIYKADGTSSSTYSTVKAKASEDGTSTKATKGTWTNIPLPAYYQSAGKGVSLYCMGNTPWLDCKISGYWNVH